MLVLTMFKGEWGLVILGAMDDETKLLLVVFSLFCSSRGLATLSLVVGLTENCSLLPAWEELLENAFFTWCLPWLLVAVENDKA
jgi:hypothetical protein